MMISSKRVVLLAVAALIVPVSVWAQASPDSTRYREAFDFWIGEWELRWETTDGTWEKGVNRIEKILDGTVIEERFKAISGRMKGYEGRSFTIYHKKTGQWRQTWVDNSSDYIELVGHVTDGKRMFTARQEMPDGPPILQRMVFYDITPDTFTWDWKASADGGKTWKVNWRIFYSRLTQ